MEGKADSAETVLLNVSRLYKENGYTQEALLTSNMLMYLYAEKPEKVNDLKTLVEKYDSESHFFDERHELPASKRLFYGYKGKYFDL